jgi:hypothetical protein
MEALLRSANPVATRTGPAPAPARAGTLPDAGKRSAAQPVQRTAPPGRGVSGWDSGVQAEVARAQEALDYLGGVAGRLEAVKGQLAAQLSGTRGAQGQLEARVRELAASLAARRTGGSLDANLDFSSAPAVQRFRIRGLDIASLQQDAPQALAFSVGSAGGPQLSATVEPGMRGDEIAARFDRALAPLKVHAQLDERGELVFATSEEQWPAVRDGIAVSGRGRVATEAVAPALDVQRIDTGNAEAVRQSLRVVVQALGRVRRSQDAASAALTARAAQASAAVSAADAAKLAQEFVDTAASPAYDSLIAITSALVGVSRERVQALLHLR